jgi:hypothetical protein
MAFSTTELAAIDSVAQDGDINIWRRSSSKAPA